MSIEWNERLAATLIDHGRQWIRGQRDANRPHASHVPKEYRSILSGLFEPRTLDSARIRIVSSIENPSFYEQLSDIPIDFREMGAITFGDTILINTSKRSTPPPVSVIFHELVHTVQYSVLGIDEFTRQYVLGWAENGFEYRTIPLEAMAYELQSRFEAGDLDDVPVEIEVRARLGHRYG